MEEEAKDKTGSSVHRKREFKQLKTIWIDAQPH